MSEKPIRSPIKAVTSSHSQRMDDNRLGLQSSSAENVVADDSATVTENFTSSRDGGPRAASVQ